MGTEQAIRESWDADAAIYAYTYDDTEECHAGSFAGRVAWAALYRYLMYRGSAEQPPPGLVERMFGVTPNFLITAG